MKRNKFALSYTHLFSCDMGNLIPVGLQEVLPGDSIQLSTNVLVRASPLLAPVMHPVDVRIHHWFVPHRLVWDAWEDFITGGEDGEDDSSFPVQNLNTIYSDDNPISYYGCGWPDAQSPMVSALPNRGYGLIWNEFYRDQDLQAPVTVSTASGTDTTTVYEMLKCGWEKDYFTSSRPWEQKGPQITIPLGDEAPVHTLELPGGTEVTLRRQGSGTNSAVEVNEAGGAGADLVQYADLTSASAITINILREALALQRFAEARARFGSRYTEYLRYLGVRSSDARLQRPEYLGGGRNVIQFSEVLQTAPTTSGSAAGVANLKGHGITGVRSNRFRRYFEEHGYIHTLMSVRPKTIYMQGIPRHFNRTTREDFWQKELETIGQQMVLKKEIWARTADPNGQFGFQDRYDEYRRNESRVSGEFKGTLNFWHLAREFSSLPALNDEFVECVPTERVFASSATDVLWCMARHSCQARRLVAKTGKSLTF